MHDSITPKADEDCSMRKAMSEANTTYEWMRLQRSWRPYLREPTWETELEKPTIQ